MNNYRRNKRAYHTYLKQAEKNLAVDVALEDSLAKISAVEQAKMNQGRGFQHRGSRQRICIGACTAIACVIILMAIPTTRAAFSWFFRYEGQQAVQPEQEIYIAVNSDAFTNGQTYTVEGEGLIGLDGMFKEHSAAIVFMPSEMQPITITNQEGDLYEEHAIPYAKGGIAECYADKDGFKAVILLNKQDGYLIVTLSNAMKREDFVELLHAITIQ